MLDPIVIPVPLALAMVAALAYAAVLLRGWMADAAELGAKQTPVPAFTGGRHRLDTVTVPYRPRDWDTVAAANVDDLEDAIRNYLDSQDDTRELEPIA